MPVTVETLKHGDGKTFPQRGQKVTVHYTGTLTDGKKFDSSLDRGMPFVFTIGMGQVIRGCSWDEGVAQMSVGQRARLICTPDCAYGACVCSTRRLREFHGHRLRIHPHKRARSMHIRFTGTVGSLGPRQF